MALCQIANSYTSYQVCLSLSLLGCETFSMINCGRWVIIDEVIVWRQLGVDCMV